MIEEGFRRLIEQGDLEGLRNALQSNSGLANQTIRWHLNQVSESDPFLYCV